MHALFIFTYVSCQIKKESNVHSCLSTPETVRIDHELNILVYSAKNLILLFLKKIASNLMCSTSPNYIHSQIHSSLSWLPHTCTNF